MEINVQVPFQQFLTIVKNLTPAQKVRLRQELDDNRPKKEEDFIEYLLNGPVYTDEDIRKIEENRKSIAAWRTKS